MAETLHPVSIDAHALTPSTTSFTFELEQALDYAPGQHVAIKLAGIEDARGPQRPFTLSSSPSEGKRLVITTKMTGSPFKAQLPKLTDAQLEECLKLRGPMGDFTLDTTRPALMVTGGIGITPFRSMIRFAADRGLDIPMVLLYSNSTLGEIGFKSELDEIAAHSERIKVVYTITGSAANESWSGRTGRIDAELIRVEAQALENPLYYICGPPGMVDDISRVLGEELQIPQSDLRVERFSGYD